MHILAFFQGKSVMLHIHDEHAWELTTQNPTEFKGLIELA